MKTIGLIGGMSWESSVEYYRIINEAVKAKLGGHHSAKCILYSVDFAEVELLQRTDRWHEAAQLMITAAQILEAAGADFLILCTNTMHKLVDKIQAKIGKPILHIADATARQIHAVGLTRIGLLGTRFTMEEDFYTGRLINDHHLSVVTPDQDDRDLVHRVIYDELCLGLIEQSSRNAYRQIMNQMIARGAQGIILGCTEIELLVHEADVS